MADHAKYTIEKIDEKTIQSCGTFSIATELIPFFILCMYLYLVAECYDMAWKAL